MKQVIFLCLLSLTLCLSKPTESQAPANQPDTKPAETTKPATANAQTTAASSQAPAQTPVAPVQTPAVPLPASQSPVPAEQPSLTNNTSQAKPEIQKPNTLPATDDNKTTEKKNGTTIIKTTEVTEVKLLSPPTNDTKKEEKPTANDLKPEEKGPKKETAAPNSDVPKTPDASKKTDDTKTNADAKDEDKHIVQARGFDGPSFIGGIILSLGVLAIGFMGFKYYKNQTERNYHTL